MLVKIITIISALNVMSLAIYRDNVTFYADRIEYRIVDCLSVETFSTVDLAVILVYFNQNKLFRANIQVPILVAIYFLI